jgi:hypothetical protein
MLITTTYGRISGEPTHDSGVVLTGVGLRINTDAPAPEMVRHHVVQHGEAIGLSFEEAPAETVALEAQLAMRAEVLSEWKELPERPALVLQSESDD